MRTSSVVLASACLLVAASFAQATTLLVDRGLPTYGVYTGTDYSTWATQNNFQVGELDSKAPDGGSDFLGDDFTLPATGDGYHVTNIRMWILGSSTVSYSDKYNNVGLMLGPKGGPLTPVPGIVPTVTTVGFADGSGTTPGGKYATLWQLDYAVDFTAAPGSQYSYALTPDGKAANGNQGSHAYYIAYLESTTLRSQNGFNPGGDASIDEFLTNGQLDDTARFGDWYGGVPNGDFSVQVMGEAVPEPITMSLVGMGIFGLGGYIRRRAKAAK